MMGLTAPVWTGTGGDRLDRGGLGAEWLAGLSRAMHACLSRTGSAVLRLPEPCSVPAGLGWTNLLV